jgi:RNA ligase
VHRWVEECNVPMVPRFDGLAMADVIASLAGMEQREGYVVQFHSGDMVKMKCPWYLRLHKAITFLRERDIAALALSETLDDVKGALAEMAIDLQPVLEIEQRLMTNLLTIQNEIDSVYESNKHLERKEFALRHKSHVYFGLIMQRYGGREVLLVDWYSKNRLREDFSLRQLVNDTVAEALDG